MMLSLTGHSVATACLNRKAWFISPRLVCNAIKRNQPTQPTYYPGIEEEYDVSHTAFHRAFEEAKPETARVPGLQEFAAAIWARRRLIPSQHDPVMHIFDEFDQNNDGELTAAEIAAALQSRGVTIDTEQVQWLINTFEANRTCVLPGYGTHTITRQEWPEFVYGLTISDLHVVDDPTHSSRGTLDSDADLC